jgi:hypothetical protein
LISISYVIIKSFVNKTLLACLVIFFSGSLNLQAGGRWVVCFKADPVAGPYGTNQTCIKCSLADSGGYGYVPATVESSVCSFSKDASWTTFSTRTAAVDWMNRNCGCRRTGTVPDPDPETGPPDPCPSTCPPSCQRRCPD